MCNSNCAICDKTEVQFTIMAACDNTNISIVDFDALTQSEPLDLKTGPVHKVCKEICTAFKDTGFVYLKNTGITEEQVSLMTHLF